jgi:uncharacterized protein (DUF1499 family)
MSRRGKVLLAVAGVAAVAVFWVGCSAPRPAGLGVNAGRLSDCPSSPNCISSQADPADAEHYAAPLKFDGDALAAWERAKQAALTLEGAKLFEARDDYAAFEITTRVLRFVDDLELALDREANAIHVRSASRLGHSDLGVNRKRVEALRAAFEATR